MSRKEWSNEKLFSKALNNKSEKSQWENVIELRKRCNNETFEKCIELSHSNNAKEQLTSIQILSQLGASPRSLYMKQTIKRFFEIINTTSNASIISGIFYGLGHNGAYLKKKEIAILCAYKSDKSLEVRQGLVFALGGLDNDLAIDTLITLTNDKNTWVRNWATFGIGSQSDKDNPTIRQALWHKMNDKDVNVRHEAIFGLAKRKDIRVKEFLKKELDIIDHHCSLILEAIELYQDKEFIPIMEQILASENIGNRVNPDWIRASINKLNAN